MEIGSGGGLADLVDLRGICLRRSGREILRNVDWRMRRGEHWAVIGANGSGKTTLLQIVGAVLFPTAGRATVLGGRFGEVDLFGIRRRIGWAASALMSRLSPAESVRDIVLSGLKATFGLVHEYSPGDLQLAEDNLRRVGMDALAGSPFGVLSQGEQQKALFARAMMAGPELLILDEPCSGLDLSARESFLGTVERAAGTGEAGVILVTHHIEEIPPALSHALILKDGAVLSAGRADEVVTSETLSAAFGLEVSVEKKGGRFWARTAAAIR